MGKSAIEWTEHTWNPVEGCRRVSPGCQNCYAERYAGRFLAAPLVQLSRWTGLVRLIESRLSGPLRRQKPTTYFVCSRSDLFYEQVPDEWIDQIFAVMALCPQHRFLVLTKRAKRMREWFARTEWSAPVADTCIEFETGICDEPNSGGYGKQFWWDSTMADPFTDAQLWPLDNVWLGVSAEDQPRAEERIEELVVTPAGHRFVSLEPLLGPVELDENAGFLDWVIVGGESGPGARPCHPDWVRSIQGRCEAAGVPFFFKQWGEFRPHESWLNSYPAVGRAHRWSDGTWSVRVGKKAAGRFLDGCEHLAVPWQEVPREPGPSARRQPGTATVGDTRSPGGEEDRSEPPRKGAASQAGPASERTKRCALAASRCTI